MNALVTPRATRREWLGLAVLALPCLLYSMDLTILNLALPSLAGSLRPSSVELLWIIDIYGFFVAAFLVPLGALGDRFGRRRVLLVGAFLFAATSVLAALATSARLLIAARACMGLAGASLAPSTLSLIRTLFRDARERTVAVGVWIASYSLGGALGPLVGGVLLGHFPWPAVFLVPVPVMLSLLVLGPRLLPEARDPRAAPVDLVSIALSLAAVLLVVRGIKHAAVGGVTLSATLSVAGAAILALVLVRRQRGLAAPLIDVGLFQNPVLAGALAAYALASFASFGLFVFVAQYLQLVAGLSPLAAGVWTTPLALTFIAGSSITPVLARRVSRRALMVGGLVVAAAGFAVLTTLDGGGPRASLVAGFVVYALGLSPVCVLAPDIVVSAAPAARAGAAAALAETGAELGGAAGIALLGSLGAAVYRSVLAAQMPRGLSPANLEQARESLGAATAVARELSPPLGRVLEAVAHAAFVDAVRAVAAGAGFVTLVSGLALWYALGVRPRVSRPAPSGSEATTP